MPHRDMRPPRYSNSALRTANELIAKGRSKSQRDRIDRQNADRLGRNISSSSLASAHHRGMSGKYTPNALHISKVIAGLNPNSQELAQAAARQKERAEIKQQKEALLRQILLNKQQQQNAGYKKTKAKTKPKTKATTKTKPKKK